MDKARSLLGMLDETKLSYNNTFVNGLIYINKKDRIPAPVILIPFLMMRVIIRRHIMVFMAQSSQKLYNIGYEREDIANEIYIVYNNCINLYIPTHTGDFSLYFNKAATSHVQKMFQQPSKNGWWNTPNQAIMAGAYDPTKNSDLAIDLEKRNCHLQDIEDYFAEPGLPLRELRKKEITKDYGEFSA